MVNEDQDVKEITNFWKQYVDHVVFVKEQVRWDTYNNTPDGVNSPCMYLWERMYVWFDGTINPCDTDYKSFLKIGNAKEKTLKELWNNPKYKKLREQHLKQERNQITPCDRCTSTH